LITPSALISLIIIKLFYNFKIFILVINLKYVFLDD
jgi:hypothetical protein